MAKKKRMSALAWRIAAGKADPISDEEREIVADLRSYYIKKYGSRNESLPEAPRKSGMSNTNSGSPSRA